MQKRKRKTLLRRRLQYRMDDGVKGWLIKTARKQIWRVAAWYELDDLIQDGFLIYQKVRQHYPKAVDPPHIMRLFQRCFTNHIHELSRRQRTRSVEVVCSNPETWLQERACPDAELANLVVEAPDQVRALLKNIVTDPALLGRPHRRFANGRRETTDQWLANLLGKPEPELTRKLLAHLVAKERT